MVQLMTTRMTECVDNSFESSRKPRKETFSQSPFLPTSNIQFRIIADHGILHLEKLLFMGGLNYAFLTIKILPIDDNQSPLRITD